MKVAWVSATSVNGDISMKYMKFFKFYLWLMVLLCPIVIWSEITDNEVSDIIDYMDYVFWLIALLGIFGYCYGKKIFTEQFWKAYLPFLIIWDLFVGFRDIRSDPEFQEPILFCIVIILYLIFILPEYVGLYLYSYKNKQDNS